MANWDPSTQYRKVAEANRQYYAKTAQMYDATETCVVDDRSQQSLETDLAHLLAMIDKPAGMVRALDACGGSGNVSLKLLRRNIEITICDISPDLLGIFQAKVGNMASRRPLCVGKLVKFCRAIPIAMM